jgi:hypothetical protein
LLFRALLVVGAWRPGLRASKRLATGSARDRCEPHRRCVRACGVVLNRDEAQLASLPELTRCKTSPPSMEEPLHRYLHGCGHRNGRGASDDRGARRGEISGVRIVLRHPGGVRLPWPSLHVPCSASTTGQPRVSRPGGLVASLRPPNAYNRPILVAPRGRRGRRWGPGLGNALTWRDPPEGGSLNRAERNELANSLPRARPVTFPAARGRCACRRPVHRPVAGPCR